MDSFKSRRSPNFSRHAPPRCPPDALPIGIAPSQFHCHLSFLSELRCVRRVWKAPALLRGLSVLPRSGENCSTLLAMTSRCPRTRGGAPSGPRTADRVRGESGAREQPQSFQLRPIISGIGCLRAACASPVLPSQVTHFPNHSVYMHAVPCVNSQSSLVRPALSR